MLSTRSASKSPAPRRPPRPLSILLKRSRNISDEYDFTEEEAEIEAKFRAQGGCPVCGLHDLPHPRTGEIVPHTCFDTHYTRAVTYKGAGF